MSRRKLLCLSKNSIYTFFMLFIAVGVNAQFGEPTIITDSPFSPTGYGVDIDGDGDIDVLYADSRDGSVYWFENLGEGNFSPRQLITSEYVASIFILPADLDGDGAIDFLVWFQSRLLTWHKNLGDGNFSAAQIISSGNSPFVQKVTTSDFDNDGDLDILFSSSYHVSVMEQISEGTFAPAVSIIVNPGNNSPDILDFTVMDVDNDGLKDIVLSKATGLGWHRNLGDYEFGPFQLIDPNVEVIPTGIKMRKFVVYDFNGDGLDDLFYANLSNVWVYENMNDGLFAEGVEILSVADVNSHSYGHPDIKVGHFNDDENLDLFISLNNLPANIAFPPSPAIYQYEYNGSEFELVDEMMADAPYITSIELQDFDQDGDLDILAFSLLSNDVKIFENIAGTYSPQAVELSDGIGGIAKTIAVDIDGDFDLDIIVASPRDGKISWYERDETGAFLPQKVISNDVVGVNVLLAEDVDQDGDIDLIIRHNTSGGVVWMENNGDGTFTHTHDLVWLNTTDPSMVLKDFNNNGKLDILYSFKTPTFFIFKGQGNGNFGGSQQFGNNEIGSLIDYTIFDADGDGFLDIIGYFKTSENERHIGWFKNDGTGKFNDFYSLSPMEYEGHEYEIAHSDLNQNGLPDIIVRTSPFSYIDPVNVHVLRNLGSGNFSSPELVADELLDVSAMALVDINLDGFPDLILSRAKNTSSSFVGLVDPPINKYIYIYYNDGTGQFLAPELFYAGGSFFNQMLFPDFDSDGDPDMLLSSMAVSEVFVIMNETYSPVRVSGEIFLDENQNGIKDSTETYPNWLEIVSDPSAPNYFLTDSGRYFLSFGDYEETYTVAPQLPPSWGISTPSQSYTFTIDSDFSLLDTLDFGIYPLGQLADFEVELTGAVPRCSREIPYWIEIDNQGTTVGGGTFHLELDGLLDYVDADVEPDSIIGQNIYWHFDSLGYYESTGIQVIVKVPSFGSIGELMTSTLEAKVMGAGEAQYYYIDTLKQIVGCAYDPNDKQVEPNQEYISNGQDLDYLIRFQNTGNDTAFTVIIKDQLSHHLDWTTIQSVSSSHDMNYTVNIHGELFLNFLDIQLPDSNVNFIESQGFARFRISPAGDLLPNTSIKNTAEIYFDFNPAIITNTVTSTIECYIAPEPHISYESPYLISGVPEGVSYQWQLDGLDIFGATENTFIPQIDGIYTVTVRDGNGCSTLSDAYLHQSVNTDERGQLTLNIYPLPSSGAVHFEFGQHLDGNHRLTVYNYQGQAVKQISLSGSQVVIPEGSLSNGFYVAVITDSKSGQKVFNGKFIIANNR